jgi:hypothetical protein
LADLYLQRLICHRPELYSPRSRVASIPPQRGPRTKSWCDLLDPACRQRSAPVPLALRLTVRNQTKGEMRRLAGNIFIGLPLKADPLAGALIPLRRSADGLARRSVRPFFGTAGTFPFLAALDSARRTKRSRRQDAPRRFCGSEPDPYKETRCRAPVASGALSLTADVTAAAGKP